MVQLYETIVPFRVMDGGALPSVTMYVPYSQTRVRTPATAAELGAVLESTPMEMRVPLLATLLEYGCVTAPDPIGSILTWLDADALMALGFAYPARYKPDCRDRSCFSARAAVAGVDGGTVTVHLQVHVAPTAFVRRPFHTTSASVSDRIDCAQLLQSFGSIPALRTLNESYRAECLECMAHGRRYMDVQSDALLNALCEQGEAEPHPLLLPFQTSALRRMARQETEGVPSSFVRLHAVCYYSPVLNRFSVTDPPRVRGGYFATEMGLGKTVVTLARVAEDRGHGPTLIVTPVSLIGQWQSEVAKKFPDLTVYMYHGSRRRRDPAFLATHDVVLTTYGIVTSDRYRMARKAQVRRDETYVAPLERVAWRRVALDEAQCIRSVHTRQSVGVRHLRATYRWCLSGTPLKSDLDDAFGALAFFSHPICHNYVSEPSYAVWRRQSRVRERTYPHRTRVSGALLWVLRRLVVRHANGVAYRGRSLALLPSLTREVVRIDLTPAERATYGQLLRSANTEGSRWFGYLLTLRLLEPLRRFCSVGRTHARTERAFEEPTEADLAVLDGDACSICLQPFDVYTTKTACGHHYCHECLASYMSGRTVTCPLCRQPVSAAACVHLCRAQGGADRPSQPAAFSKLARLRADLARFDAADKVLIFTQFADALTEIRGELDRLGVQYRHITGGMTKEARARALRDFDERPEVRAFVLSTRTASVGINLTAANRVIVYDVSTNKGLEEQAVGRAWRIGQQRPVVAYHYCVRDTVEDRLLESRAHATGTRRLTPVMIRRLMRP